MQLSMKELQKKLAISEAWLLQSSKQMHILKNYECSTKKFTS
jgi:hypothetical protein